MIFEALEIVLRLLGGFYVLAGIVGMRVMVMDHLMDQMLAGISLKPVPTRENQRRWLLGISILAIGMGGMALMVLSLWAVPLFAIGAATQAFYLVWARSAFPVEDEIDRTGRRQTTTAALLYFGSTVLVLVAAGLGALRPWLDPWAGFIPVAGAVLLALVGRHFLWTARRPGRSSGEDFEEPPREIPPPPARVRLAPNWYGYPLRDADTDEGIIFDDYLPRELGDRLYDWTLAFHASEDYDSKQYWARFEDAAAETAHRAEGAAIVAELARVFGAAEGPVYPPDIRYGSEP